MEPAVFVEALQKDYTEYLLDILLSSSLEEHKAQVLLLQRQRKEVMKLEQRIAVVSRRPCVP